MFGQISAGVEMLSRLNTWIGQTICIIIVIPSEVDVRKYPLFYPEVYIMQNTMVVGKGKMAAGEKIKYEGSVGKN